MTERIHCGRCRMSFRVGVSPSKATPRTRCAEPHCPVPNGRRFWHSIQKQGGPVVCGVDPNETEHRPPPGGERAMVPIIGAPAPAQGADASLFTTPAPGSAEPVTQEPAAFCRGGRG